MSDAAGEARALVARTNAGTLGTVGSDGAPWASLVAYAVLADGAPVLCVSTLAEHGRNLASDPRASLAPMPALPPGGDPLAVPRVTLSGRVARPDPGSGAREAFVRAVPGAGAYVDFADFALWVLRVERVRWVGGYGRMETVDAGAYAAAVRRGAP